jgi:ComF family protein
VQHVKQAAESALGFFFPNVCQLCGVVKATAAEGYVCHLCSKGAQFVVPPFCDRCGLPFEGEIGTRFECANCREVELRFSHARAAVRANDFILDVIHRFKYGSAAWFEPFLAGLFVREAAPALRDSGWEFIVPVPLHPVKQREREFNQSTCLARTLAAGLNVPMNTRLLRRVLPTKTQTRLSRAERANNVANAFALRPGAVLSGERIVLVDDVLTTGATTSACAKVLRAGGSGEVCVWTLARAVFHA